MEQRQAEAQREGYMINLARQRFATSRENILHIWALSCASPPL